MKKFLKFICGILTAVIFILCFSVLVCVMVSSRHNSVPKLMGYSFMSMSTKSMVPNYNVGDLVAVKEVGEDTLKENDVISFFSSDPEIFGLINTHRIVKIEKNSDGLVFTTKGDNNPRADEYKVLSKDVIGKVVFKISFVGKAVSFLQNTRAAYFIVIILPLAVIMAFEIRNLVKRLGKAEDGDESENE